MLNTKLASWALGIWASITFVLRVIFGQVTPQSMRMGKFIEMLKPEGRMALDTCLLRTDDRYQSSSFALGVWNCASVDRAIPTGPEGRIVLRSLRPMKRSKRLLWHLHSPFRRYLGVVSVLLAAFLAGAAEAAPFGETASSGGLIFYFSVVPSELIKGPSHLSEQPVHHGAPQAAHEHHVFVAIFDAADNARVTDAVVTAKLSGLASAGLQNRLEPMTISEAIVFGALFNLYPDLYTITVTAQRPGAQSVVVDFTYDHRQP